MQTVLVYNPTTTPAIYGDGMTLGGMEWMEVPLQYVEALVEAGCILVPEEGTPPVDLDAAMTDADLLVPDEVPVEAEESVSDESDDPVIADEPDTISKPRRRKQSQPEKE